MDKKKKSFLSFVPYFLGGLIVGMFILNFEALSGIGTFTTELSITGLAAAAIFTALGISGFFQLKSHASKRGGDMDEDESEQYMYRKYADNSLCIQTGLVLSLLVTGVAIIQQTDAWIFTASGITMIAALLFLFLLPTLLHVMYPERDLPSSSDSDFADKLLHASDEGERHVMLEGLYKTFNTINGALFLGLIILMMYSISTGDNQIFGMIVIAAVLITANVRYVTSIRDKV
ncbi:hypothetical protein WN59_04730 [Salinicoccus sediminis]|uniref:DUF3169 domain-containing protein n=1 Tax=Salinicoccus sediminis TaxID=1432562 RepID=A0A0M2SMS7_9STAP|nr:DUF3169 family protein [Salinicoccus sediminis]KKK34956.1 hypothetical protein WN59_04730 [Salinicoccus sediminis]